MAQQVKTSRRIVRISTDRHSLESSADGRSWSKVLGSGESIAKYSDLISYKDKVYAITTDNYGGSIKVLDELASLKHSSGNMRNRIIRFEHSEDGMLHGLDEKGVHFVPKDEEGRDWVRYDTWKTEMERKRTVREKIKIETAKTASRARAIQKPTTRMPYKSHISSNSSHTPTTIKGCFGELGIYACGCIGTMVALAFFIWIIAKIASWFF